MSVESAVERKNCSPLRIWSVMVTFFIYQFIARSSFPTVLTEEYMRYFCLDAEGVGALVSCYYIAYTLVQIPVGIIIDRFSLKTVAPLAALTCATGVGLFISTQDIRIASIGQTLVGLGSAFSFLMVLKTCIDWFPPEKRAVMLTYASSVGCMGPVIFGPLVATLVKTFDWRNVMMVHAIAGYILACVMWNMLEDKKDEATEQKAQIGVIESLKVVVSSPQAWILALFALMQYSPLSALADLWGTSYIKKLYDADATVSSLANNMIYIGMVVGGPLFSHFAVHIDSYKKALIISSLGGAITFAIILFLGHCIPLYGMFALFFITGFCASACLQFPLGAVLHPKEVGGVLSGFMNMGSMLSGVILMPLIGYLIDTSWNGTIENGIKVYSLHDFIFGLSSVFVTLLLAVVLVFLVKDKSPRDAG